MYKQRYGCIYPTLYPAFGKEGDIGGNVDIHADVSAYDPSHKAYSTKIWVTAQIKKYPLPHESYCQK